MMDRIGVLFVCTGNICRSPTAEAVFRHLVKQKGMDHLFVIDSAGTHGYHIGDQADPRTIETAARHGVDMADLRARKAVANDFEHFDYIYAMDQGHYRALAPWAKGAGQRAALSMFLMDNQDVPDPYYGTGADFQRVFDMVHARSQDILDGIVNKYGLSPQ